MADINVQLHLIANGDIDRLEKAFQAFDGAINKLTGTSKQIGGGGGVGHADMVGSGGLSAVRTRQESKQFWANAGFAAVPGQQTAQSATGGLRSAIGSRLGPLIPGGTPFQKAAFALAFGPQLMNNIAGLSGSLSGAIYGGGLTSAGVQLGQSRTGSVFGIPTGGLLSPAFNTGFLNQVAYPLANITNPYASQAQGLAAQYGYNVSQGQSIFNMFGIGSPGTGAGGGQAVAGMIQGAMAQGVGADTAAQWIESLRYGGTNIGELSTRIKLLGDNARAAHMSVQTFSDQLQSTAMAFSQSTGAPSGYTSLATGALSTATGFTPSALQPILTNKTFQGVAVAMAGGDMAKAFMGRNAGLNNVRAMEQLIAPQLGYQNFAAIARVFKSGNQRAIHNIWNRLLWLYNGAPDLFNGMTPIELIRMITNTGGVGGMAAGFQAAQDIQTGMMAGGAGVNMGRITGELRRAGIGAQAIQNIISGGGSVTDKLHALANLQSNVMRNKTDVTGTNNTTKVVLSGYAAKIFRVAQQEYNLANSSNSPANPTTAMTGARGWAASP